MQTSNREDSNLRSFLNYLLVDKGLSNNTVKAYEADISSFFQWLDNEDLKYKNLQEDHINQYISFLFQRKMRSSSVNRKISSIKSFYIFLVKRKGDVRQAKLFYLRERSGKSARIKERLE